MNKSTARKLALRIERDEPSVSVSGLAYETIGRRRVYDVRCYDTRIGYPVTVRSLRDWLDRRRVMGGVMNDL